MEEFEPLGMGCIPDDTGPWLLHYTQHTVTLPYVQQSGKISCRCKNCHNFFSYYASSSVSYCRSLNTLAIPEGQVPYINMSELGGWLLSGILVRSRRRFGFFLTENVMIVGVPVCILIIKRPR